MKSLGERLADPDPDAARQGNEDPWYISTKQGSKVPAHANSFGIRQDPHLGVLAASTFARTENRAVIHRTWSLLNGRVPGYNGAGFHYNEYEKASSVFNGWLRIAGQYVMATVLSSAILYKVLKSLFPAEGEGPDPEESKKLTVRMEVHAVAEVGSGEKPRRVRAGFTYPGGPYLATAMFLAEGGVSLVYSDTLEGGVAGGCLTPALLGDDLVERIRKAGARIEVGDV